MSALSRFRWFACADCFHRANMATWANRYANIFLFAIVKSFLYMRVPVSYMQGLILTLTFY